MKTNILVTKLDALVSERSLLKHPFYRAWSAGELSQDSLAGYAKEYFQLVKTVPGLVDDVRRHAPPRMQDELAAHRDEEEAHVNEWARFAGALGVSAADLAAHEPRPETRRALATLTAATSSSYEAGAAALYALELEIPKIAQTKMDGLGAFYGLASDDALSYFRLHAEADVRHAATWRAQLGPDDVRATAAASASLDAQHLLLDGCVAAYC